MLPPYGTASQTVHHFFWATPIDHIGSPKKTPNNSTEIIVEQEQTTSGREEWADQANLTLAHAFAREASPKIPILLMKAVGDH